MSSQHPASSPPTFVTTDLDLSAYLEVSGLRAKLSRVPDTARQVQFEFPEKASALADAYYSGGLIPARLFAESLRSLKARIMGTLR